MERDDSLWSRTPYTVLFQIFQYLDYNDLIKVGEVCRYWYQVSHDELLWKRLFYYYFNVNSSIPVTPGESWLEEFQRLCYHTPTIQTETLTDHINQVLHVSFSHDGRYFATCSKDGYVLLYNSDFPATVKHYTDMRMYSWQYAQFSQFNESDTLLLVSGIHSAKLHSTSGVIAVFNLEEDFQLQCHVINKPYDLFGTWYSDQMLLSGDLHWLAHLVSVSHLWINKASQEADSERVPVTQIMYRFYNRNASSIRSIMIGDCLRDESLDGDGGKDGYGVEVNGDEFEHFCRNAVCCNERKEKPSPFDNTIVYAEDYRTVEEENNSPIANHIIGSINGRDDIVRTDKYLIFTTGTTTFVPHQIGLKRIKPFNFPESMDMGLSLKERLILRKQQKQQSRSRRSNSPSPEPDFQDYEIVADLCDKIDHLIDLRGHIVGMALSPDHRYLYVNNRPWPPGYQVTNPLTPPPITQDIDVQVIDLVSLKVVGSMLHKQKTYTAMNDEAFFIFLDVSDKYVASGSEDKFGYLWDRHYGVCLAKFPHTDVVNAVAFNPKDPEMLVTASDDNTVKVWRSRAQIKGLQLHEEEFQKAVVFRRGCEKFRCARSY